MPLRLCVRQQVPPLLLSRELIVCFKVKVHSGVTDPPSGVTLGLHHCGTIVCVVLRSSWLTSCVWKKQGEERLPAVRLHLALAPTSTYHTDSSQNHSQKTFLLAIYKASVQLILSAGLSWGRQKRWYCTVWWWHLQLPHRVPDLDSGKYSRASQAGY